MTVKHNIIANYASQFYVIFLNIMMVPLYIKYMGDESYGLVGVFSMLQALFQLLDMGLTPTIARETAKFRGGACEPLSYLRIVRALEGIFFIIALAGSGLLIASSSYIASDWLQSTLLSTADLQAAVQLMAIIIALRWMCGLYRGVISGSERLVWLGSFNIGIATLRVVVVLYIVSFFSLTPTIFFFIEFILALTECAVLIPYAYRLLPSRPNGRQLPIEWSSLKPVLKFSLSMIFTSSVWVFVTQTDKLVLSKILPLADFGYFTLAVMAAGGVLLLVAPVTGAVMPLMVRLAAERDQAGFVRVYRTATQLVVVIAGSASITLGYCAEPLLLAWTNNDAIAYHASPILMLYAIGNGILAMSGFPYLLQYAKGDLRLHLIGNILYAALLIPLIIWSAKKYGGIGAGYVWVTLNLTFFLIWVPYVHKKLIPGIGMKWFFQDVLPIYISALLVGYLVRQNISFTENSKWQLLLVLLFGLLVLIASVFSSTVFWSRGKFYIRRLYGR